MLTDEQLENIILLLQKQVRKWALKHDVWKDCQFQTYFDYWQDEPSKDQPVIMVLLPGDDLIRLIKDGYSEKTEELEALLTKYSCSCEYDCNYKVFLFTYEDEETSKDFIDYFWWQWVTTSVKPDYTDLYDDLFTYFGQNPARFLSLDSRQFEVLISELLRQQGYDVVLGPGRNDGGVDITLYNRNSIPPFVTLVQVKRYDTKYAIELSAVAALYGTVKDRQADKGLFATCSRFLPSAKKFAARHEQELELADRERITDWSYDAAKSIKDSLQPYLSRDYIAGVLQKEDGMVGRILYTPISNAVNDSESSEYFIILKDTKHACLIMHLPKERLYENGQYTCGFEIPVRDIKCIYKDGLTDTVFRVRKKIGPAGEIDFYGQQRGYYFWDGRPRFYLTD